MLNGWVINAPYACIGWVINVPYASIGWYKHQLTVFIAGGRGSGSIMLNWWVLKTAHVAYGWFGVRNS